VLGVTFPPENIHTSPSPTLPEASPPLPSVGSLIVFRFLAHFIVPTFSLSGAGLAFSLGSPRSLFRMFSLPRLSTLGHPISGGFFSRFRSFSSVSFIDPLHRTVVCPAVFLLVSCPGEFFLLAFVSDAVTRVGYARFPLRGFLLLCEAELIRRQERFPWPDFLRLPSIIHRRVSP